MSEIELLTNWESPKGRSYWTKQVENCDLVLIENSKKVRSSSFSQNISYNYIVIIPKGVLIYFTVHLISIFLNNMCKINKIIYKYPKYILQISLILIDLIKIIHESSSLINPRGYWVYACIMVHDWWQNSIRFVHRWISLGMLQILWLEIQ